jgi:hypothetical protein
MRRTNCAVLSVGRHTDRMAQPARFFARHQVLIRRYHPMQGPCYTLVARGLQWFCGATTGCYVATVKDPRRSPLLLADEATILRQSGISRSTRAQVYQTLSTTSSVYLEFAGTKKDDFLDDGAVDVYLRRSGVKFKGFAFGIEVTLKLAEGRRSLKQRVLPSLEPISGRSSRTLVEVEFAVANGAEFFLLRKLNENVLGGLTFEGADWKVDIAPVTPQHRSLEDHIEADDARLTHSGMLRRVSGMCFTSEEAWDVLSSLSLFLAFAAGWWVGIGFIRGRNTKGKLAWQVWGFMRMEHEGRGRSWHHWKMDGMLAQLFPGFLRLLHRPTWREPLGSILYWYNRSNSMAAGVDGSIILTQAGFELLAWQVLVQDSQLLSEENFHSLNAEGQVRVLLGHLGIPLLIPSGLGELIRLGKELNWSCGPQALVAIRNQLVHPAKKRGKTTRAHKYPYHDAWLLGQHLLELCILRLCEYNGTYIDRTSSGVIPEPIPVPWKP